MKCRAFLHSFLPPQPQRGPLVSMTACRLLSFYDTSKPNRKSAEDLVFKIFSHGKNVQFNSRVEATALLLLQLVQLVQLVQRFAAEKF